MGVGDIGMMEERGSNWLVQLGGDACSIGG